MVEVTQGQRNLKTLIVKRVFKHLTLNKVTRLPNPPPVSSYGTTTTAPTSVHRKGLTSLFNSVLLGQGSVIEIPSFYNTTSLLGIFILADSSNVIKREEAATGTLANVVQVLIFKLFS